MNLIRVHLAGYLVALRFFDTHTRGIHKFTNYSLSTNAVYQRYCKWILLKFFRKVLLQIPFSAFRPVWTATFMDVALKCYRLIKIESNSEILPQISIDDLSSQYNGIFLAGILCMGP